LLEQKQAGNERLEIQYVLVTNVQTIVHNTLLNTNLRACDMNSVLSVLRADIEVKRHLLHDLRRLTMSVLVPHEVPGSMFPVFEVRQILVYNVFIVRSTALVLSSSNDVSNISVHEVCKAYCLQ